MAKNPRHRSRPFAAPSGHGQAQLELMDRPARAHATISDLLLAVRLQKVYVVLHMQCEVFVMKSATIPPLRVTPELRQAAESVLQDGESLSNFVEKSLVKQIEFRRSQAAFIARGLAARDSAKESGKYVSKEDSLEALDAILDKYRGTE